MRARSLTIAAAAAIAVAGAALAVDTPVQKTRVDAMKQQGGAVFGTIGRMAKGETPYDSAKAVEAAEVALAIAERIPELFPEGSGGGDSNALPAIWTDWDGFRARAAELKPALEALRAAAATGDATALGPALGPVGQSCTACHDDYRKPLKP